MKRILLTLPIAALLAAPMMAKADTANVTLYGTLNTSFENVELQNSVAGDYVDRFRLVSNSTNFGLKGWEDLGSDWKFIWQLESSLSLQSVKGSVLGGRNSFVGVSGTIGTFQLGYFDTPWKSVGQFIEPFYATGVGYLNGFLGSPGLNTPAVSVTSGGAVDSTSTNAGLSFDRRQGTALQYMSPTFMGLTLKLFYSAAVDKSTNLANPSMWDAALNYENGPLLAGYSIERHDDFKGNFLGSAAAAANGTSADWGHKVAVGYKLSDETTLGAEYSLLSYASTNAAGTETDLSRSAVAIGAMQKFSDWTLRLGVAKAFNNSAGISGSTVSIDGSGAYLIAVGGSYSMSKRSDIYLLVARVQNDYQGTYNFSVNPVGTATVGTYPTSVALGLRHVF